MTDAINHPSHYNRGGIEAIDVIDAWGLDFDLGNVVKYVSRAGHKSEDQREDLEKAAWYLAHALDKLPARTSADVAKRVADALTPWRALLVGWGFADGTVAANVTVLSDGDGDWICPRCERHITPEATVQKMMDGQWAHTDCAAEQQLAETAQEMSDALNQLCSACLVQGANVVRAQCRSHSNLEREEAQRALDAIAADPIPF